MSPKIGRPKSEKLKQVRYSVRLYVETEENLSKYYKEKNIWKGEAIRNSIQLLLDQNKK